MIQIQGEPYLSSAEAAARLGVRLATLYAYVSRGVLRSYRQGIRRERLYREKEIEQVLRLHPARERQALPHATEWIGDP